MTLHNQDAFTRTAQTGNSYDPATRTLEAVIATTAPVVRRDARGPFNEVLDLATLVISDQVPLLDSHKTDSVPDLLGKVESIRVEGSQVIAKLRITDAPDADPVAQRIADGSLTGLSIGYKVAAWKESIVNGQRQKSPTEWTISEVTLTTNPADPGARVRSQTQTPAVAVRAGRILKSQKRTGQTNGGRNMPDTLPETTTLDSAEIERRSEIRGLVRAAGLEPEAADQLIDAGADLTRAKAEVFDVIQTRAAATPIISTTQGVSSEDPAVITRRQSEAVATRMGSTADLPDDARQYMGDSLLDMARDSLTRMGVSVRGLAPSEVFTRASRVPLISR